MTRRGNCRFVVEIPTNQTLRMVCNQHLPENFFPSMVVYLFVWALQVHNILPMKI